MIRIIERIMARSLDLGDGVWAQLPMVAATGTIEKSDKTEDEGRTETVKINVTLSSAPDIIRDSLIARVMYGDGDTETFGSEDLPLRFTVTETDIVRLSCSYQRPIF